MATVAEVIAGLESRVRLKVDGLLHRAYQQLQFNSPVDTGRFRANWRLGVGEIDTTTTTDTTSLPLVIPQYTLGQTLYLTESLPYAIALEHGHSRQAPSGVAAVTALELTHGHGGGQGNADNP